MKILSTIVLILSLASTSLAIEPCELQLSKCDTLVHSLQKERGDLKELVLMRTKERDEALSLAKQNSAPTIPGWVWAIVGAAAGVGFVSLVK